MWDFQAPGQTPSTDEWNGFKHAARAAIEAMNEPTDLMVLTGNRVGGFAPGDKNTVPLIWEMMVKAALK